MVIHWLQRSLRRSIPLISMLLLCACAPEFQLVMPLSQPTATITQSMARIDTLTATSTSIPTSTPTNNIFRSSPTPNPSARGMELVKALQQGGLVIYLRAIEDAEIENSEICLTQSILSDRARAASTAFGRSFLTLGIPVDQVLTGDGCSSYETGLLAFGTAKSWVDQNGSTITLRGERISILRQLLSSPPPAGTNNVLVGNESDIMDVTGITLAEGEAAIYQPLGKTGYSFVARLLPSEWQELRNDLPDLVQVESCDFDDIQLELVSPIYGAQVLPKSKPEQGDGNEVICMPEEQLGFSEDLPLPDLITLPPFDLRIRVDPANGQKILRFSNSIMNIGLGAIELSGTSNPDTGKVTVDQTIFTENGSEHEVTVGEFFFHTEHNHWHFGRFSRYEIWSLGSDGELESIVAFSDKISYCLRDDSRADIPNAASRQTYSACDQNIQGISVGWIDTYRHHLDGQSIDITALPDGVYALRSVVDPDKKLWDRDYENNAAVIYIELEGNRVTVIDSKEG